MRNILYLMLLLFVQNTYGQTYISGNDVVPFSSIASSSFLPTNGRIDVQHGYNQQKVLQPLLNRINSESSGEFWMCDGMLINLTARVLGGPAKKKNLEQDRLANYPTIAYLHGTVPDRSLQEDYFEQIDTLNDFEVFIHYFKSKNYRNFVIQDLQGRYIIRGEIHAQAVDRMKAANFIQTLLQSITFN